MRWLLDEEVESVRSQVDGKGRGRGLRRQPVAEPGVGLAHDLPAAARAQVVGPDGPEGPRPSDWDPDPPPARQMHDLREQGLAPELGLE